MQLRPAASIAAIDVEDEEEAMRRSCIRTERSTDAVAMMLGWYLFQSSERTSVGCAGMVRLARSAGAGVTPVGSALEDPTCFRSQILSRPSDEHDASVSGEWGEKSEL